MRIDGNSTALLAPASSLDAEDGLPPELLDALSNIVEAALELEPTPAAWKGGPRPSWSGPSSPVPGQGIDLRSASQPPVDVDALVAELAERILQGMRSAPRAPTCHAPRAQGSRRPSGGTGGSARSGASTPAAAAKPAPASGPAPAQSAKPSATAPSSGPAPSSAPAPSSGPAPSSAPAPAAKPGAPSVDFTPNEKAVAAARDSALGKELARGAEKNAAIYREASEKTGVPASMVAAIHFNEGHMGKGVGPESGYGLDPRYVSTERGNAILAKYGMGAWERGTGSELSQRQSAVIAADMLKSSAKAAGVEVKPGMSGHDAAVAIHAYGTGSGSKSTKAAKETGRGFMFDPSDDQPHVRHPGGTSIGKDGEVVKVPPGVKSGLLRWDVALPLLDEKLGAPKAAEAEAPKAAEPAKAPEASKAAEPAKAPDAPKAAEPAGDATRGLPPRAPDAMSGSDFAKKLAATPPGPERERLILEQVEAGNVPESFRRFEPVTVERMGKDGKMHTMTMNVAPDYVAIGSDADNIRVPMTPGTAQKIAERMNATLPTTRMVDDIDASAKHRLNLDPIQWKPGAEHGRYMLSGEAFAEHDRRCDRQLEGQEPGGIASGHKKDLVIPFNDGKVAIYGARGADGKRVQPYSNIHEASYADYSHGARMVDRTVMVDGKPMDIRDVMADPNLAPLVSDRGPIR